MADEEVTVDEEVTADEPTEIEILQEISNDIKYFIKCTIALSRYKDFEYPEDESEGE